jgi:hypothetical protein
MTHRCGCLPENESALHRRDWFRRAGAGGMSLLMAGVLADLARAAEGPLAVDPLAPRAPHFGPRAKRVIFLYMSGGVSHVESFDPKPQLVADHGKSINIDDPFAAQRSHQPL